MPVGTHRDDGKVKEKIDHTLHSYPSQMGAMHTQDVIFNPLNSIYASKAFSHLLLDGILVDNTTAGKELFKDVAFQSIRQSNFPLKI